MVQFENGKNDSETRIMILELLREVNRDIDRIQDESEWPKVLKELSESLEDLNSTISKMGEEKSEEILSQINSQSKIIIEKVGNSGIPKYHENGGTPPPN